MPKGEIVITGKTLLGASVMVLVLVASGLYLLSTDGGTATGTS
ncbi:MAG: hypothetical protein ACLFTQ_04175 [Candidatus Aenigmatarchaeota archaeon]